MPFSFRSLYDIICYHESYSSERKHVGCLWALYLKCVVSSTTGTYLASLGATKANHNSLWCFMNLLNNTSKLRANKDIKIVIKSLISKQKSPVPGKLTEKLYQNCFIFFISYVFLHSLIISYMYIMYFIIYSPSLWIWHTPLLQTS